MRKLLFILLVTASAFSVYAGGGSELDKMVNPDSIAYFEITDPDKGIEQIDAVLNDFGLMQILGVQSIKQELLRDPEKPIFQYMDFGKPIGFSLVYSPDAPEIMGTITYIPLKNKKDFKKMLQDFNPLFGEVLVNEGSYAVLADNEALLGDFPYKKNFNMDAIKDKDKHLLAGYVAFDNLLEITNEEGLTIRDMLNQELAADPEFDMATGKVMNAYIGVFEQIQDLVFYADMDGTVISADTKMTFRDNTKAEEFITKIPGGNNTAALLEYIPDGYMINAASDTNSETTFAFSKMIMDLLYRDDMSNAVKAQIESLIKSASDLSGPSVTAFNMDYSKLMGISMMGVTSDQMYSMEDMDLIDLMGMKLFQVIESSNPRAYIEAIKKMMDSDAYMNLVKELSAEEDIAIDLGYGRQTKYRGITFDEFSINMEIGPDYPDEYGFQKPPISFDVTFYMAENGKLVYTALGEGAKDVIAEIINNGGKPEVSVLDNKAVAASLGEVPEDAVMISTFSMMKMIESIISGFTSGMDLGQMMGGSSSAGGYAYMTIENSDVFMKGEYDFEELRGFVTFMTMIMQMAGTDAFQN